MEMYHRNRSINGKRFDIRFTIRGWKSDFLVHAYTPDGTNLDTELWSENYQDFTYVKHATPPFTSYTNIYFWVCNLELNRISIPHWRAGKLLICKGTNKTELTHGNKSVFAGCQSFRNADKARFVVSSPTSRLMAPTNRSNTYEKTVWCPRFWNPPL